MTDPKLIIDPSTSGVKRTQDIVDELLFVLQEHQCALIHHREAMVLATTVRQRTADEVAEAISTMNLSPQESREFQAMSDSERAYWLEKREAFLSNPDRNRAGLGGKARPVAAMSELPVDVRIIEPGARIERATLEVVGKLSTVLLVNQCVLLHRPHAMILGAITGLKQLTVLSEIDRITPFESLRKDVNWGSQIAREVKLN